MKWPSAVHINSDRCHMYHWFLINVATINHTYFQQILQTFHPEAIINDTFSILSCTVICLKLHFGKLSTYLTLRVLSTYTVSVLFEFNCVILPTMIQTSNFITMFIACRTIILHHFGTPHFRISLDCDQHST